MPDAVSTLLQLTLQTTGGNENTWGDVLNDQLEKIEQAIAGMTTISTTGGDTTLTNDQARPAILEITGGISSNVNIVVPSRTKQWTVFNRTAGAFPVRIKTAAGVGYVIPKDLPCTLFCDGDDVFPTDGAGSIPIGGILYHGGASVPDNFLEMAGAEVSRTTYARLFAIIGTTFGVGNGTSTFNLPDHRDRYFRGRSSLFAIGASCTQAIQSHTHEGVVNASTLSMSGTTSTEGGHTHTYTDHGGASAGGFGGTYAFLGNAYGATTSSSGSHSHSITLTGGSHTHTFTTNATGSDETRPNSIVGLPCIRYQ